MPLRPSMSCFLATAMACSPVAACAQGPPSTVGESARKAAAARRQRHIQAGGRRNQAQAESQRRLDASRRGPGAVPGVLPGPAPPPAPALLPPTLTGRLQYKSLEGGSWTLASGGVTYRLVNVDRFRAQPWFREGATVAAVGSVRAAGVDAFMDSLPRLELSDLRPAVAALPPATR